LDGSRILVSFLKLFFPFRVSKKVLYFISLVISIFLFVFLFKHYNALFLLLFLAFFLRANLNAIYNFDKEYKTFLLNKYLYFNKDLKRRRLSRFLIPINYLFFSCNVDFDYENFLLSEEVVLKDYFKKMKD
jgi:hypothetical protein